MTKKKDLDAHLSEVIRATFKSLKKFDEPTGELGGFSTVKAHLLGESGKTLRVSVWYNDYGERFRASVSLGGMLAFADCRSLLAEIPHVFKNALLWVVAQRLRYRTKKWRDVEVQSDLSRDLIPDVLFVSTSHDPKIAISYILAVIAEAKKVFPDYLTLIGLDKGAAE